MSDEPEIIGDNQKADLNARVEKAVEILDEIDDAKLRLKELKDEAKSDGYEMKAFNQVVKEKRKGASYQAAQLELEAKLTAYRGGVDGVETDLAKAQERARSEAGEDPDEKKAKRKRSSTVVKFPGKPN